MNLDQPRLEILAASGHLLIVGGPGCGKTSIALLKAREVVPALEPEQSVLFLSFSRAAVRQISDRMTGILDLQTRRRLEVRTFHAFFMDVVRSHGRFQTGKPSSFITPDEEQQLQAAFEGDWAAESRRLAADEGKYVFDLLACTTAGLFERYPILAALYSDAYPVVIVDEFQDTNDDQWRAIRALSSASTVICLADPDQRIYDHLPGVNEQRIQDAIDALQPKAFDLSKDNHRSPGQGLLAYANAVLRNDPSVPVPNNLTYGKYSHPSRVETVVHAYLVVLRQHLLKELGREPTVAVLAPTNALVGRLSETAATDSELGGKIYPAVDHELNLDQDLATASAYVVASIMEWPGLNPSEALTVTVKHICNFYRVKSAKASGARKTVVRLERALHNITSGTKVRSNTAKVIAAACSEGIQLTGSPVQDWQLARARLSGSIELKEIFGKARLIRLLEATDAIAWALTDAWNGTAYTDAAAVVRRVLANRMIEAIPSEETASTIFMNMYKSKGKEFDGVIIAETRFGNDQLIDFTKKETEIQSRRRLLRVAITRARHHVVIIRHASQPPLIS
ncbi:UvrD-helicase domain-containing protein [Micromonospora sp. URMC 106]|uniref:UvrD-helicase domain-containing protein n=1 Tax=Micromonospora sp. URMC 106 TaxID=3423408 RepID=UPI003F1959A8